MSAYPLVAKRQVESHKMKMAMAVRGKSTHYQWEKIQHRHWLSTARVCGFPVDGMEAIIKELFEKMDFIIENVKGMLPATFPEEVAQPIFDGMKSVRDRLKHTN